MEATLDLFDPMRQTSSELSTPKRLTMAGLCNIVRQSTSAPRFLLQVGCSRRAAMQKLGFRFEPVMDCVAVSRSALGVKLVSAKPDCAFYYWFCRNRL
jgi:hypothetical protein